MTLTFALLLAATRTQRPPIHTPYAKAEALAIRGTRLSAAEVPRLGLEEIEVDAHGTFDNPFDPADVALDAHVVPPSGKAYDVPGFYYRGYERKLDGGTERLTPSGEGRWLIRLAPMEEGNHQVEITFRDRTGTSKTAGLQFRATKQAAPGMVRVSSRDRRYFEHDDGTAFYPVAANVGWGGERGTFDYDDWLTAFGKHGMNLARVWLGPAWTTFAMETVGKPEEGKGLGQIDLANAWRLDYVADLARREGIDLQLCIESYNILRDRDAHPYWDQTPHNMDNGGPIRIWTEFWTNEQIDRTFRAKLRYLVARYGAYSNVFAWELWNEVDLTRDFDLETVRDWHRRMAAELHRLDPYRHPVTTSMANTMGNRDLELIPELDFFQTHHYGSPDLAATVVSQQSRKTWGRPHLVAEIGADASGPRASEDPKGIQIHDPQWASVASGVAGTASPWWWDNYIAPKSLYPLFQSVARFVRDVDWPGEAFQIANLSFAYQAKPATPDRRDLVLEGGPVEWAPDPSNRPKTVIVTPNGASGLPVAGIQHGLRNHPDLHNPVRFRVSLPRPTRFEVIVSDVSGYGGATLRVELDGDRVLTRDFPDPDDSSDPASLAGRYAGRYGFTIPAGSHTVKVENVGKDWFMASYRFVDLISRATPPVQGWAVIGNDLVLGWFRPEGRTWSRLAVMKANVPPAPPSVVGIPGLPAGTWTVEYWDTWNGTVVGQRTIKVGLGGKARVPLPKIDSDLAIKMRRTARL